MVPLKARDLGYANLMPQRSPDFGSGFRGATTKGAIWGVSEPWVIGGRPEPPNLRHAISTSRHSLVGGNAGLIICNTPKGRYRWLSTQKRSVGLVIHVRTLKGKILQFQKLFQFQSPQKSTKKTLPYFLTLGPFYTGWWFQIFSFSPRKLGKIPILTIIFFKGVETIN